jgi:hypothetical protein
VVGQPPHQFVDVVVADRRAGEVYECFAYGLFSIPLRGGSLLLCSIQISTRSTFTFGIWSCGGPRSLSLSVDLGRCNVHTVDGFQLASCDVRVTLPTGAGSIATFAKSKPRDLGVTPVALPRVPQRHGLDHFMADQMQIEQTGDRTSDVSAAKLAWKGKRLAVVGNDPMSLGMSLAMITALAAFWAAEVAVGLTIGASEMVTGLSKDDKTGRHSRQV